jgi:hypothetical protein
MHHAVPPTPPRSTDVLPELVSVRRSGSDGSNTTYSASPPVGDRSLAG